jgi:hypothetical protein
MNLWTVGCADPRLTAPARSPMGQAGEKAMRFPRLAHRSAAAHKLHSTPQQDRMNLISGKGETSSRLPAFSLFLPGTCPNNRDRRTSSPVANPGSRWRPVQHQPANSVTDRRPTPEGQPIAHG